MENQEKLILSLIKDDLINSKLVGGLEGIGLVADDYLLHLKETILDLMGFSKEQRTDLLYTKYMERMGPLRLIDIHKNKAWLEVLARDIYEWLCKEVRK